MLALRKEVKDVIANLSQPFYTNLNVTHIVANSRLIQGLLLFIGHKDVDFGFGYLIFF